MSAIPRSRSIRKPPTPSSEPAQDSKTSRVNASPSRLPVNKPIQRSDTSTVLRSGRVVSGAADRKPSIRQRPNASTQEPGRRDASHYPPSTTVTRPTATRRPSSADGESPQPRRVPTHTRAKSTVTSVSGATILRAPSQSQSSASSSTTTTTTTTTRSLHARKASVDKTAATASSASSQPQPRLRPAFTTLQQHFSPAKNLAPKPLTSSYLAPPSPSKLPANVAASAETSRLQGELLQLHLLDRDATTVEEQWHASAKDKLGERFEKLARAGKTLSDQERASREDENALVLRQWGSGLDLEEKIQHLDAVAKGVWSLSEPGGRYARVVKRFERWISGVCEVEEARKDSSLAMSKEVDALFIGELDASWGEECASMIRKLDGWQRQLQSIEPIPEDGEGQVSSLGRMMGGLKSLVLDMLAELTIMDEMQQEALAREDEWIRRMNREDDADDAPRAGAIWRSV
ncbi:hypothetical protein B0I35DRAFT_404406 [Stachybotrys elegans]|uniref:Aga1 a-agglutinin anchor subunit n=1 Tax=Stachybotrys elegans TaxID=80388 RepID=A0A8K0T2T4_9HYPO|nr:hypothetical protein B0I35DRAFT_404406 [Stachybotrys elegans]